MTCNKREKGANGEMVMTVEVAQRCMGVSRRTLSKTITGRDLVAKTWMHVSISTQRLKSSTARPAILMTQKVRKGRG